MEKFQCVSISDGCLASNVAVATARAGGIGILDCEYVSNTKQLVGNIEALSKAKGTGQVGLKIHVSQVDHIDDWLGAMLDEGCIVVVSWHGTTFEELQLLLLHILKQKPHASVWLEVHELAQMQPVLSLDGIAGILAKGYESGGWVGEDAAFILSQKIIRETSLPVYIQGGIGIHSAAACRAIGAAGVVLEEQLFLMPESGLHYIRPTVEGLNGKECMAVGEHFGAPCRILDLPRLKAAQSLKTLRDTIDMDVETLAEAKAIWQEKAKHCLGWDYENQALPMGQAIALAATFADTYKTTGRLIQTILQQSKTQVELAKQNHIICKESPLAQAHQTTYPFVQGPMTRVSDTPGFAKAVADGGALPLIALAVLKAEQIDGILAESEKLLRDQSWGVGLLGFIDQTLYEAQLQSVLNHKPPFALIAGGRPDQAKRLEDEGISTYIHAPTPELLRMFIGQGARKFVFEGRECGGHVGPLSSFVLWEQMIEVLLEDMPKGKEDEFQLLFAGGIHDGLSATMVNVLAAPLVTRGAKVGVLMGTVYLFTEEAVSQGSILQEFQNQAIQCESTINLVTGPGHASRCVNTTFAEEFYATRRRLLKEGVDAAEVSSHLDALSLGRLRIASKGVKRDDKGNVVQVSHDEQLEEGMYMIGQVATLHHEKTTVAGLHESMVQESLALVESIASSNMKEGKEVEPVDIAIVGVSTLLPGAHDVETYWQNILNKREVISEIPKERWDWRLYFDADRKIKDKIYMKNGGFFGEVPFDPMDFGIPPNSLRTIEPIQLLTLGVVQEALKDAGYESGNFDRENTSVILGASGGLGDLGVQYAARTELDKVVGKPNPEVLDRLPDWNEESFSGLLLNVAAGRVANRFDLGGTNQTVDAACGSSLAALKNAVQELESGVANVAIAGGIDTMMSPFSYMCFAKTQALSPSGTPRPFDKHGDGIVISEGIAVVVLKRLADAERDGDRIYGVIKGVGSSSDGRALGMTAPLPRGQMRALDRAYQKAGYTPDTVALFEAHGTGTNAGDKAESETIINTLHKHHTKPKSSALGSVKSQIGHTKATAGTAALIKAVLALHHKVQPPHMNVSEPLDVIADAQSPVFILNQKRPWFAASKHPRRAGVSAFGFGGTNYHATLEEYTGGLGKVPAGSKRWPHELFVFKADSQERLLKTLQQLQQALAQGSQPELHELAAAYAYQNSTGKVCLSLVADNLQHLQSLVTNALESISNENTTNLDANIHYSRDIYSDVGRMAWMYPGQGSQYVNMGIEHALYFEDVRQAFEEASHTLDDAFDQSLYDIVFPPSAFDKATVQQQQAALTHTHVAQPALAAYSLGLTRLLMHLGVQPDAFCGHSLGEYSALCAAGVFTEQTLYHLVETRGRLMGETKQGPEGTMAAIKLPRDEVETWLKEEPTIVVANHNAPQQTIISGEKDAMMRLLEKMEAQGVAARQLPVSGAFHSPLLSDAQQPLAQAIADTEMLVPTAPVYANKNGKPYAQDTSAIKTQLSEHLLGSVEFVTQIEVMYASGVRTFVEVGAKNVLSNLVKQILGDKPHRCIALDADGGRLKGLQYAIAQLVVCTPSLKVEQLFAERGLQVMTPTSLLAQAKPKPLGHTSFFVSGDKVRHHSEPKGSNGRSPMLTMETQSDMMPSAVAGKDNDLHSVATSSTANPMQQVLLSYQQTMREFLALQEKVVTDFLQGGGDALQNFEVPDMVASTQEKDVLTTSKPIQKVVEERQEETNSTPQSLLDLLVSIVAERTGYPEDMLDPDQDMEAELGIDSIKRVEIMGTLQDRLPTDMVAALQDHMDTISRTKSLRDMVTQIESLAPQAMATSSSTQPVEQTSASTAQKTDLLPLLVSIVAERTGYPEDMLDPDQDMEAELGIDSIKRVEIMGTLQDRLPTDMVSALQDHMDTISRTKSLRDMVAQIETLSGTEKKNEADHSPGATVSAKPSSFIENNLPRFTMTTVTLPEPQITNEKVEGCVLITPDRHQVASKVVKQLQKFDVESIVLPEHVLNDMESLESYIQQLLDEKTKVIGLIHLSSLIEHAGKSEETCNDVARLCHQSLFTLLKPIVRTANNSGAGKRVLSASLLQAYDTATQTYPPAISAGLKAMMKTLRHEYGNTHARSVDFDAEMSPMKMAKIIVAEFLDADSSYVEICYQHGQRISYIPEAKELSATSNSAIQPDHWVVLVTGGAKGITAEVLKDFAPFQPTLVLVGRTPLSSKDSDPMQGIEDPAEIRKQCIAVAKQEGRASTPVVIEKEVQAILSVRAIRKNIERLESLGAKVDYHSCDVTDDASFAGLIEGLYDKYGRIDAVVHAAGIIDDQLLVNKSVTSFSNVFDTKVSSALTLMRHIRPENLKLWVFFSSISGRFGNAGQVDYAAANEVLNELAIQMKAEWSHVRVKSINWGPWDSGTGMVTEAAVQQMAAMGIAMIAPKAGRDFFKQEVLLAPEEDVVVVASSLGEQALRLGTLA